MLFPPGGSDRGGIRYHERVRKLAPLPQVLEQLLTGDGFKVSRVGSWERFTTAEGEHAAAVTISGSLDGAPAQRDLGVVLLDDCYASISGYCLHPEDFSLFSTTVRELARGDTHLLGDRRRRYEHDMPAGWQARARGFHAEWFPLDYPRAAATITVWAALPARMVSARHFLDLLLAEDPGAQVCEQQRFTASTHGLDGQELIVESHARAAIRRSIIVLEDDRYIYPVRVEAPAADHTTYEPVLRALAASVRPVPRASHVMQARIDSLDHWSE